MKRSVTKLSTLLAVAAGLCPSLRADKGSMDSAADKADAVVVGEIQSEQQNGSSMTFVLSVVRSLKGDPTPGSSVDVSGTSTGLFPANSTLQLQGDYGLWFLKKTGSQWTFLPAYPTHLHSPDYIALPKTSSPLAVHTNQQPTSTSDLLAVELAAAIENYTAPSQLSNLSEALVRIQDSAVIQGIHDDLRSRTDPELKFIGLLGLLASNEQASALAEIAASLDVVSKVQVGSQIVSAISGVRGTDPPTIQTLGKLAQCSYPDVQRSAAEALQRIHTGDTLPLLGQLLGSSDQRIRESALWGFTKFVENRPVEVPTNIPGTLLGPQGPTPYRTPQTDKHLMGRQPPGSINEAEFVQFWQSWWATMAPKLAPGK